MGSDGSLNPFQTRQQVDADTEAHINRQRTELERNLRTKHSEVIAKIEHELPDKKSPFCSIEIARKTLRPYATSDVQVNEFLRANAKEDKFFFRQTLETKFGYTVAPTAPR